MTRECQPLRCSFFILAALTGWGVYGQDINSVPSPVGSGARALGMGGAFIAVADDATAASWNPGGLTQLERPELSLVYNWKSFNEEFKHTTQVRPNQDTYNVNFQDVNFASAVYPIPLTFGGRNLVLALSYQRKLDFDRQVDVTVRPAIGLRFANIDIDFMQEGGLATLTPAVGFELTNQLSIGLAVNIWDSSILTNNRWKTRNKTRQSFLPGSELFSVPGLIEEDFTDYSAINYTLGLLYKPNGRWSVGAVYHSRYASEVRYKRVQTGALFPGALLRRTVQRSRLRFEWPASYGLGAAYRFPNDKLTVSFDMTWRDWGDFVKIDPRKGINRRTSPVTGLPIRLSPHDPTWTVRLGAEYVFIQPNKPKQDYMTTLRAGIFYDPEPASGRKDSFFGGVRKGDGDPDDFYGFSLGGGLLIKNRINIDAAYQLRWGNNVKRDTFAGAGTAIENDFHEDVIQHQFFLSTVVYF